MRDRLNARIPAPANPPLPPSEIPFSEVPPRRVAGVLLPLLVLAGLIFLLVWACDDDSEPVPEPPPPPPPLVAPPPPDLVTGRLDGPRDIVGHACLALISDVSSSMVVWAPIRAGALDQLRDFSRDNLLPDDRLAVIAFDDVAETILAPTRIQDLTDAPLTEKVIGGGGTVFAPAVDAATQAFAGQGCSAVGVAVISDGGISDSPPVLSSQLDAAGFNRLWFLVPGDISSRPAEISDPSLSKVTVYSFTDERSLGAAYGQLLAEITGRQFVLQ